MSAVPDSVGDWASNQPDNWSGTNGGNKISLSRVPQLDQIEIEDIARALSNICRFGGQIKRHYSVAQHSLHVMELVPEQYKFEALMHDAAEAYTTDIPTPLKRELGNAFSTIELRINVAVGERFKVDLTQLPDCVHVADRIMCVSERDQLCANPLPWGPAYEGCLRYPQLIPWMNPEDAYAKFLTAFQKYRR